MLFICLLVGTRIESDGVGDLQVRLSRTPYFLRIWIVRRLLVILYLVVQLHLYKDFSFFIYKLYSNKNFIFIYKEDQNKLISNYCLFLIKVNICLFQKWRMRAI